MTLTDMLSSKNMKRFAGKPQNAPKKKGQVDKKRVNALVKAIQKGIAAGG